MKSLLKMNKYSKEYSRHAGAISYSYFVIFNVKQAIKDTRQALILVWSTFKSYLQTYIYLYVSNYVLRPEITELG